MGAVLLRGVPPAGRGVYARNQSAEWLAQWDFVALNAHRRDAPEVAAFLRRRLKPVWLYSTPEYWRPATAAAELRWLVDRAKQLGAVGIIANPEAGWSGQRSAGLALGRALKAAALKTRVGLVTIPLWPQLAAVAETAGGAVWFSPELYAKGRPPSQVAGFWDRWVGVLGTDIRMVLSVSGWNSDADVSTPEGYAAYLAALPESVGAIAWLPAGSMPRYQEAVFADFRPGGNAVTTLALRLRSLAGSPAAAVAIALGALAIVFALTGGPN